MSVHSTFRRGVALLAVGAVFALTACSGSGAPQPTDSADSPSGVITVAARNNIRGNYDPQESPSGLNFFMTPVFETLVVKNGEGEYEPSLATEWEVSEDNAVLTLTIREGVTFHDGEVLDAEAVKASIERGQTLETSAIKRDLAAITSIEVVDDQTVAVHLDGGGADRLLGAFTRAPGVVVPVEASKAEDFRTHPVGTGPWQVSDQSDPTSQMVYQAYSDYWDPSVQGVERIEIKVLSQQAAQNGALDGSIDFIEAADRQSAQAAQNQGLTNIDSSTAMNMYVFQMNKQDGALFSDENLRLALSSAIDRDALAESVFYDLGFNDCVPSSQAFAPSSPFFNEDVDPVEFDPKKAKQYMTAAGYPDGFTFTVTASSTFLGFERSLTAMKQQLEEVGITMNIELQPLTSLTPNWLAGQYDALYQIAIDPTQYYGAQNLGTVSDPTWAVALDASFAAPTVDAQTEALQEWSGVFQDTASSVTVCNQPHSVWVQPDVHGLTYPSIQVIQFKGVTVG